MRIENTDVYGWAPALRAMRNPLESWAKSDSSFSDTREHAVPQCGEPPLPYHTGTLPHEVQCCELPRLGSEDLKLACRLIKGGSEHRKFLRQIIVWADLTLPRYVWTEWDTYKVATVRNSCSTMHKLGHRDLTEEDFQDGVIPSVVLELLNLGGRRYREQSPKNPSLLRELKQLLPEAFLQMATITCSYETLLSMHHQRRNHRLREWSGPGGICEWIRGLPYMKEFLSAAGGTSDEA